MQYWEMGLPTYHIQMYQKALPIIKHTDILEIVLATGKHQKSAEKVNKI